MYINIYKSQLQQSIKMHTENKRRHFIQKASVALFGLTLSQHLFAQHNFTADDKLINNRYPEIDDELRYSVVNAAHFDLDTIKN